MYLVIHPQCSDRSHITAVLERLIGYMSSFDDARFAALSDLYDRWTDSEPVTPGTGAMAGRSGDDRRPAPFSTGYGK